MEKLAQTDFLIHDLLKGRWSPRAYSNTPVENEKLLSLFEAARWSPSGGNSQPWSFIITTAGQAEHKQFVETLAGFNSVWAGNAALLVLAVTHPNTDRPGSAPYAYYDLGQSVAHLNIQAEALGLQVHQMAGFDKDKVRALFEIPEGFEPMTVIAIGYSGNVEDLPEPLRERELQARTRKPLVDFVFDAHWNTSIEAKSADLRLIGSPDGK